MKHKPRTVEELLQARDLIYNSICVLPYDQCKNEWNRLGQIEDTLKTKHHIKRKYTREANNTKR